MRAIGESTTGTAASATLPQPHRRSADRAQHSGSEQPQYAKRKRFARSRVPPRIRLAPGPIGRAWIRSTETAPGPLASTETETHHTLLHSTSVQQRQHPFSEAPRRQVRKKSCVGAVAGFVCACPLSEVPPRSPHSVSKDGFQFCQATLLNHRPRSLLAMPCKRADAPRSAGTSSYLVGDVASLSLV
jgi:hypothetical protein